MPNEAPYLRPASFPSLGRREKYVKAEKNVPEVSYLTWLKPLKPLMLLDGKRHIVIGLGVLAEYVEKQYGFSIIRGIEDIAGFTVQLRFVPENVYSVSLEKI